MRSAVPNRPRILAISFSEFLSDARVLRQLRVLTEFGDVTTIGYGGKPVEAAEHLELPRSAGSLPQTPGGIIALALRRFRRAELLAPANRAALRLLAGREFDLVVANEARALPLAHAVAKGAPVWGDMHEWAPEERTHVLSWRLLVGPFMRYVCRTYLPKTEAVTTVNESIATLYREQFGCHVDVVRNAIAYQHLAPSPMIPHRVRLVHSGSAVPGRSIERLIEAALALGDRFSLDLYLVTARDGGKYLNRLRDLAGASERVTFHQAVDPGQLPATLNQYDIGVFVLPPRTANHRFMLPNKFFDFVQARLCVVFSPAVETTALIREYAIGRVTEDFSTDALVTTLRALSEEEIEACKRSSDAAAAQLSSEQDERVQRECIGRLLGVSKG